MFFDSLRGIIALDIDGTITNQAHELDSKVIDFLHQIVKEGWFLIFITGRPFQWTFVTLESLVFSYALAVQNGALLLQMPSRKILIRKSLTQEIIPKAEKISQECQADFVVYSGFENEDCCYYRMNPLSPLEFSYGLKRAAYLREKWYPLQTFSDLPISHFSSIKFFIKDERALLISHKLEKELGLHAPLNRDPFDPRYFVIQATDREANKGSILNEFISFMGKGSVPIIAAGNDDNDRPMLNEAHIKIVMADAPLDLLAIADIIAPPADQQGIIQGLTEAIHRLSER